MQLRIRHEQSIPGRGELDELIQVTATLTDALARLDRRVARGEQLTPLDRHRAITIFARWNRRMQRAMGDPSAVDDRIHPLVARWLRDQLQPYLLRSAIGHRSIRKPAGYAGDSETILRFYRRIPEGADPLGELIDAVILRLESTWSVFHRRRLLADEIHRSRSRVEGRPTRVTSLACGPAEELVELIAGPGTESPLEVTLFDIDPGALIGVRIGPVGSS